jgi:hypothetical protein
MRVKEPTSAGIAAGGIPERGCGPWMLAYV